VNILNDEFEKEDLINSNPSRDEIVNILNDEFEGTPFMLIHPQLTNFIITITPSVSKYTKIPCH
jgi:hypothetical protein